MPDYHSYSAPNALTIDEAYSWLLHPAHRVLANEPNYYVYTLFAGNDVLYIGYTDNVSQRRSKHKLDGRIPFTSYSFIVLGDETAAKNLERQLISKHRPPYNRQITEAVLNGTSESRQIDKLEKIRRRDIEGLARLEAVRSEWQDGTRLHRDSQHEESQARHELNRQVRIGLWRNLLASPLARTMTEFEAVAYISQKWGEIVSPHTPSSLQGFDVEHAIRYGIEEANLISLFQDWIGFNRVLDRHKIDGRTFTSETVEGFASHIKFITPGRVRDALDRLVGTEVLDKVAIPVRTGRMLGYAFRDGDKFLPDWWQ